jgi:hypothetical protein
MAAVLDMQKGDAPPQPEEERVGHVRALQDEELSEN